MRSAAQLLSLATAGLLLGALSYCSPEELSYGPSGGTVDGGVDGAGTGGTSFDASGWVEVCGNGIDDDDNGLTDCEDPVCNEYACVPAAPSGWTGPVAVFPATPSTLPDCPEGLDPVSDHFSDPRFERATCSSCGGCGAPNNESCTAAVGLSTTGSCNTVTTTVQVSGSSCTPSGIAGPVTAADVKVNVSGNCGSNSQQATPTTKAAAWGTAFRACESPNPGVGVGCEAGQVCSPASAGADPCILQVGEHACPADFPARRLVYASQNDTRDCSNCNCGFSGSCTATVKGFNDTSCTIETFSNTGGCAIPTDVQGLTLTGVNMASTCNSNGGSPRGCVLPETPTTMCCAGTSAACPSGKGPEMITVPTAGGGSYCIDSTEVTNTHYEAFLATTPTPPTIAECAFKTKLAPDNWPDTDMNEPVNSVDWCDAYAFCAWAGKRLCGATAGGATPFANANTPDSQWHNACSAGGTQDFPYGTDSVSGACPTSLKDVKEFPCCQGGYSGIYDLAGFGREWIDACDGTAGTGDNCRVMGRPDCNAADSVKRNKRDTNITFRCCAP